MPVEITTRNVLPKRRVVRDNDALRNSSCWRTRRPDNERRAGRALPKPVLIRWKREVDLLREARPRVLVELSAAGAEGVK